MNTMIKQHKDDDINRLKIIKFIDNKDGETEISIQLDATKKNVEIDVSELHLDEESNKHTFINIEGVALVALKEFFKGLDK